MNRNLSGKKPTFAKSGPKSNPYRVLLLITLIVGSVWLAFNTGYGPEYRIQAPFMPTPTPTRTAGSYLLEADAYFNAGVVSDNEKVDAIESYNQALELEPDNALAWAELARLQTYSSSMLPTQEEKIARMAEARISIEKAVELAPDDSTVNAIHALVLDWSASVSTDREQAQRWLVEAEQAAGYAYNQDPDNYLALAFYAEVLLDQQKWSQAEQHARTAVELAPDVMDTHRVYAIVLETFGQYRVAIEEYEKAAAINPNLTFLYINIGLNYRTLAVRSQNQDSAELIYEQALEYFSKAADINEANGVLDPIPYIAIAKTYAQMGEFFIAGINAQKALRFNPTNPVTYGQLGDIYRRARNYESAELVLECVVLGCTQERAQEIVDDLELAIDVPGPVEQLALTNDEAGWFYAMYGSTLAALSRPNNNKCTGAAGALAVMSQVRQTFPENSLLMGIVEENEAICRIISQE
jgi:tetratricopeptide (TPR) repeat protein